MLTVGIGGMFGAVSRYLLSIWIKKKSTHSFPIATWLINIIGSFLLGMVVMSYAKFHFSESIWQLIGIGFLGAFTTFSTFCVEVVTLLEKQKYTEMLLYVCTSIVLGILFAGLGCLVILTIS